MKNYMSKEAYIVLICFLNHFFKSDISYTKLLTGLLELILSNVATAIFVKIWEGGK